MKDEAKNVILVFVRLDLGTHLIGGFPNLRSELLLVHLSLLIATPAKSSVPRATAHLSQEYRTPAWEQRKLGELTEIKDSARIPNRLWREAGVPYIRASDISQENLRGALFIDEEDYAAYKAATGAPEKGDVLFNGGGEIGKAIINGNSSPIYVQGGAVLYARIAHSSLLDARYLVAAFVTQNVVNAIGVLSAGGTMKHFTLQPAKNLPIEVPNIAEQRRIGAFFDRLDSLITLHQRKYDGCAYPLFFLRKVHAMQETITSESLFCDYYTQWVKTYKEGAIRDVTMGKYRLAQSWLGKLIPELKLAEMDRTAYQRLINGYAQHHERQTTMDFHHQIKGAILDAVDEGLIPRDPTRKVIIKGKQPRIKKMKYLNQFELHAMLADLDLGAEASWDWLILLIAKTGLRFSEALGLTPDDFDFAHQTLSVSKTWDYKNGGGFVPTKNESSVRKVQLDWQLIMQLSGLLKNLPHDKPIFVHGKVYNSTANDVLARHCKNVDVPVISIHGLRHTHASLLLFAGVSIASVSRRLGHASMTTTQETYLHVIRELENKDVDIVMRALSTLI
nr:tyrosine-type recombinase/integrase [Bifidobacterium angulatum]